MGLFRHLADIAGLDTYLKEVPGHGLFGYSFIPVVYAGKTNKIPIFDFFDDINIFDPVFPAFYAVTFHHDPPMGPPLYNIGEKNRLLKSFGTGKGLLW
jgi:hypothetical protein